MFFSHTVAGMRPSIWIFVIQLCCNAKVGGQIQCEHWTMFGVLGLFEAATFYFWHSLLLHGVHGCPLSFCVCAVWYVGDGGWHSWRMMEPDWWRRRPMTADWVNGMERHWRNGEASGRNERRFEEKDQEGWFLGAQGRFW
jgi:hypothetical protein